MKTGIHWKILIPFILTPILALGLFIPVYLKVRAGNVVPSNDIIIPLGVFGTLGLWLILTTLLRAKTVKLNETELTIRRIFTLRKFTYVKTDITSYSLSGHLNQFDHYSILQFTTKDNRTHSVVSYELRHFEDIVKWVRSARPKRDQFKSIRFVLVEYGVPFIIGFAVVFGMLLEVTLN